MERRRLLKGYAVHHHWDHFICTNALLFVFPAELCDLDCGQHGRCVGETCLCDDGWGGDYCNAKLCDARCNEHGQCKNGTCLCVTGWNGKHCTMEGCPSGCSAHGQCRVSGEGLWECRCYDGWDGGDCAVPLEQNCADNKDNDKGMSGNYAGRACINALTLPQTVWWTARIRSAV